jgi:hypothetical protein
MTRDTRERHDSAYQPRLATARPDRLSPHDHDDPVSGLLG